MALALREATITEREEDVALHEWEAAQTTYDQEAEREHVETLERSVLADEDAFAVVHDESLAEVDARVARDRATTLEV